MMNASQTCALGGAVLMAGTIAAMQRLSTENHLGLPAASVGPTLIVLSRNVATCYNKTLYNQHTNRLVAQATAHSTSRLKSLSISSV